MAVLSKEDILNADDMQRELVPVPEWGGSVWVYGMTGEERDAFEAEVLIQRKGGARIDTRNIRAKMAARCLRDEAGKRMFGDADIKALAKKSAKALDRVFGKAQELSGISDKDVEELAGELKNDQSGASGSSSA
jgi:hypothetical protein